MTSAGPVPVNVLVTGASGFVGGALVRRLIDDRRLRPVAALRSAATGLPLSVATVSVSDLTAADAAATSAWAGISVVVHCAARVHVMQDTAEDPLAAFRAVNVDWTLALARAAAAAGVRRFVFVSSIKVNGERTEPGCPFRTDDVPAPIDPYGQSKLEAEQGLFALAESTGLEVVVVRPPLVYGPGVRANFRALMRLVGTGLPLPLGGTRNLRSLVGLDNLVDLLAVCCVHPSAAGQAFMVSDGHDVSTGELACRIARAQGRHGWQLPCPERLLRGVARALRREGAAGRLFDSLQVDIAPTRQQLGWEPPITLDEGLRRTVLAMNDGNLPHTGGRRLKRFFDLALCAMVLLVFLIPLAVIALAVRITSPGPALYWSDRVGRDNRIFRMPKFRSMRIDTPAVATHLLDDPARWLTPIGSFLRRSSLDELPQLWSILRGDMSLVGPRPALFNQHDLIALRTEAGVHTLVPGLTGWAQINGRDELPIPEKVRLDAEYLARRSFAFDLRILCLTALKVLLRQDVTH